MNKPEKFWDRSANGYDREEMKDRTLRTKILEKVKKHLRKQDDVLDFGCATGILANEIAADVHTVHGIDISPKMIQIAQNKAREQQISNVTYARSTVFDEKGTFDVILGIYLLHLLEDMPAVLEKIH
ncbi:class I SAM-dependent methyltransferase, partial [Chitinophaga sp.]|uniref:class I SAM-dependent methyltransferase n=1 Tax=Chitinophaga sp. TaxID=1869181 RepID=UPI002F91DC35